MLEVSKEGYMTVFDTYYVCSPSLNLIMNGNTVMVVSHSITAMK